VVGADPEEYISTKRTLARLFQENFKKYEGGGGHLSADLAAAVLAAGPAL
jgi:phosphoenolpyruvate carboxykinase (ATP)